MSNYRSVNLAEDQSLMTLVEAEERIGIDTEFMREKTYFAQLCLVQVAAQANFVCADPLPLADADEAVQSSVWQALTKPTWILHSGRQDIEVVYQTCKLMPPALFDTQVAAALLGYQPQIGYAGLVAELFDVELEKSHTRADWSKRPLSDAVLNYAAEDVEYLLPACDLLTERLEALGRLEWALEDSSFLLDTALYEADPDMAIDRVKGARNMTGQPRSTAVRLAAWREREALRTNRPRQWIMRDAVLLDIASTQPTTTSALGRVDALAESTVRRAGDALLEMVAAAQEDVSDYRPPSRPDERQKAVLKQLQKTVAAVAEDLGLVAEIVAPKKELSAAMLGQRKSRVFSGWRQDVVGNALLEIVENQPV